VLNRPPAKPFEDVRELGALIKQIGPGQHHVGLLYKLGQEIRFVHLAWHYRLLSQEPTPDYFWVQSGLDETNRRVIAPAVASSLFASLRRDLLRERYFALHPNCAGRGPNVRNIHHGSI
jgi:hypothetical protein